MDLGIKKDITILEKRVLKLINKNYKSVKVNQLKQFHILIVGYEDSHCIFSKEKYLDYFFIKQLQPRYYNFKPKGLFGKKERYLMTITLITDLNGTLVGTADATIVNMYPNFSKNYSDLAKMLFNKEVENILMLDGRHILGYYVCVTENKLFAIEENLNNLKIYNWPEFIETRFDKWTNYSKK